MTDVKLPPGISQRANGLYMGRFTYQGQRYTLYNKSLKKLQKEMMERQYEVEHGIYCRETEVTVEGWFETWIKEYKMNSVKVGTIAAYTSSFNTYIRKPLGKKKLSQIRPEHVQKLYNDMSEKYAKSTINLVSIVLGSMCKQAVKNGLIQKNPVELATLPRKKKGKEIRVMKLEEQKLFLQYAKPSHYYTLYVVALNTGMRLGELRALKWENVDFENNVIHVRQTMNYFPGKGTMLDAPKTESSVRDIPMLDEVSQILKLHKIQEERRKLLLGEKWKADFEGLVFTSPFGKHVNATAVNVDMKQIENDIHEHGIEFSHIHPHVLRHTFATRGLERGIPPKVMQELLGHTSITMTLDIYSHVLPDMKAAEIQKLANICE